MNTQIPLGISPGEAVGKKVPHCEECNNGITPAQLSVVDIRPFAETYDAGYGPKQIEFGRLSCPHCGKETEVDACFIPQEIWRAALEKHGEPAIVGTLRR